jgi:hypothetical protein
MKMTDSHSPFEIHKLLVSRLCCFMTVLARERPLRANVRFCGTPDLRMNPGSVVLWPVPAYTRR